MNHGFHIINAAAGSGKTYTLVLAYLRRLLATPQKDSYQQLLAMTFTNKAVNEMKGRILSVLADMVKGKPHPMIDQLQVDLALPPEVLQRRAQEKLQSLLHNYSAFEVTTLDSFTHGVIRTFAFDLGLSQTFDVVLDSKAFIRELVDLLVAQVGVSAYLTDLLTQFSLRKVGEEKSWDVSHDLNLFSPILINENDRIPLKGLKQIHSHQFQEDLSILRKLQDQSFRTIQKQAEAILETLKNQGLEKEWFTRGLVYTHFERLAAFKTSERNKLKGWFSNQLGQQLETGEGFYKKSISAAEEAIIQKHWPTLRDAYQETKKEAFTYLLLGALQQQWVPLSLLGALEQSLETQQKEQNRMLLGRFNERISTVIQDQPVPFIYERLGTRYRHFFIDEFQDTSGLQWTNLIPLLANTLENDEQGSLVLVGDPKQAIYRWRGGDVQQYLDLIHDKSPFQRLPEQHELETNYRSYSQLIAFNNTFFPFAAQYLKNPVHQDLFGTRMQQKCNEKTGGTVAIHRIPNEKKVAEREVHYAEKVVDLIQALHSQAYTYKDITVLIRKKKQALVLVHALQETGIPAVSSDSLLLSQSSQVMSLVHLLRLVIVPQDTRSMKPILDHLWQQLGSDDSYHDFMVKHLGKHAKDFFKNINPYLKSPMEMERLQRLTVYEALEYVLASFQDYFQKDAYIDRLLDLVFGFTQSRSAHTKDFLDYWDREQEQLTISLPSAVDAVQIMTVHKSKGLEFPVVIYPFLEDTLRPNPGDAVWYSLASFEAIDTPWARLGYSEALASYGAEGQALSDSAESAAALDAMNLLYVGLTRAVQQLHLITMAQEKPSKQPTYATILNDFIRSKAPDLEATTTYYWSQDEQKTSTTETEVALLESSENNGLSWRKRLLPERKNNQAARDFGVLIHDLLGAIKRSLQLEWVVSEAMVSGRISKDSEEKIIHLLRDVITQPKLEQAFAEESEVWIEQDILLPNGKTLRPDRVCLVAGKAIVIDFKTGLPTEKDQEQIRNYAAVITTMGYEIEAMHLVYIQEEISIQTLEI